MILLCKHLLSNAYYFLYSGGEFILHYRFKIEVAFEENGAIQGKYVQLSLKCNLLDYYVSSDIFPQHDIYIVNEMVNKFEK